MWRIFRFQRKYCTKLPEPLKDPGNFYSMRAVDEIRTRDIHLGKVVLYQLSYDRMLLLLSVTDLHQRNEPPGSFVGDTGIEPVTSSVSGKRATAAPIAQMHSAENSTIRLVQPNGGGNGIRTRVHGFAGRCLASRPPHREN